MSSADDRRGHARAPIELKVEYKKLNTFFFDYTRNIGKGGTFIKTSRPLPIGTEFLFKLVVPRLDDALSLVGVVRWVVDEERALRDPEHPDPGMGIEFVYQNDADRAAVEAIVEQLMVSELGELAYSKLMDKPD